MDFEKEEKEIIQLVELVKQDKPPKKVMENFEEEVVRRIHQQASFPWGLGIGAVALAAAGAGVLWFVLSAQPASVESQKVIREKASQEEVTSPLFGAVHRESPAPAILKETEVQPVIPEPASESPDSSKTTEDLYDVLIDDLFILEMLGEDEGLVNDLAMMEPYAELLSQSAPVSS